MSISVFLAVVFAALLHASWNATVKSGGDKLVSMSAIVVGHTPLALIAIPFVPLPAPESWPFIMASALIHITYQFVLLSAYRVGDFTLVYPVARGSAPLLVTAFTIVFLSEQLTTMHLLAVLLISGGILNLGLARASDGLRNPKAAWLAVATGCCITSYSLVDGFGARAAGTSVGFYAWMTCINTALYSAIVAMRSPASLVKVFTDARGLMLLGGGASFIAYAIATWAFTQAPIALVMALRESSIIFALLIGVLFLNERFTLIKYLAIASTVAGAILMRLV